MDFVPAESHRLVEDGERITHGPVRLHGYDMEGLVVDGNVFLLGDGPQVPDHVGYADPVEIIGLAAREDGRQYLVLLGRRKDENSV